MLSIVSIGQILYEASVIHKHIKRGKISVEFIFAIWVHPNNDTSCRNRYLNDIPLLLAGRYGMAAPWYFPLLPSYWVEYNSYLPFWNEKRRGFLFSRLMLRKEATLNNKICMWMLDGVVILTYVLGKRSQICKGTPYSESTFLYWCFFVAQEKLGAVTYLNGDLAFKLYLFFLFRVDIQYWYSHTYLCML